MAPRPLSSEAELASDPSVDDQPKDSVSESELDASDSDSNSSDSDSLDSHAPRKRRRISPTSDDEDSIPVTATTSLSAPSRIKKKAPIPALNDTKNLSSVTDNTSSTFASLGVNPWLANSLKSMAIKRPTPIQSGCIPEILAGRDCIGGSRTGSGKTVAFAVPILQKWAEDPFGIFALILTPTRELALQIYEQFLALGAPQSLKALLLTGGSDISAQATALARRPHVLIATPGRLADHIASSGADTIAGLRKVKMLVLDEADRLLAEGTGSMLPDIKTIMSILPSKTERQTLLFTATMTPAVLEGKNQPPIPGRAPVFVCEVENQALAIPEKLKQSYITVPVTHRVHYLHAFLLTEGNVEKSIIIFCNRTDTAEKLTHLIYLLGHRVTSLHSKLRQRQRVDNLARFRDRAARILVATDLASRGLDIPSVDLVLNYDIPRDADDYIHRVGRTARSSRSGTSVTLVGQRDVNLIKNIESRVGQQMSKWAETGVNLETRVLRDLKIVGEKIREAEMEIEEGREVGGKRKTGMTRLAR